MTSTERWPPIYDAVELARTIQQLAERTDLAPRFFEPPTPASGDYCQGDIFEFTSPMPLIDENGDAVALGEIERWMLVTNSCDLDRSIDDMAWAQLIPLDNLGLESSLAMHELTALRRYQYARRFYVPDWRAPTEPEVHCADFTRPVTIHRTALGRGHVVARLSFFGWILLHACLVRFLARDDGRYDVAGDVL